MLVVVLHSRGCFLIERQLLRAVLEEVDASVGTLVGLEIYHVMRLLQVALVRTTLHLSSRISRHILRVPHFIAGLARFTPIVSTICQMIARVRRLSLEHVVRLVQASLRNIATLMRSCIVLCLHMLPTQHSLICDNWLRAIHGLIGGRLSTTSRVVLNGLLLLIGLLPRALIAIVLRVDVVVNVVRMHD